MDGATILKAAECDLKRLPLGALEAFVLSQIDGRLNLEEIAEVAGLDFTQTVKLAKHLLELGAVATCEPAPGGKRERAAEKPPEKKRGSRKSLRMQRVAIPNTPPAPRATSEVCELDETTLASIVDLDAKLKAIDHYAVLGIERDAGKKEIKDAYIALAGKFHPDNFFGKKLGRARGPLERIVQRLIDAHHTLSSPSRRVEYDEKHPAQPRASKTPPARMRSLTPRRVSRSMKATRASETSLHAAKKTTTPPPRQKSVKPEPIPEPTPAAAVVLPPLETSPILAGGLARGSGPTKTGLQQLYAAAKEIATQSRVELFVQAAEAALKTDDVIGAANNYRLALEHRDDPDIRRKLEAVDALAIPLRIERSLVRARFAEREERWAEAAEHLLRAYDLKADPAVGDRAAYALRLGKGDLRRATTLGEHAISVEPKNASYRMTLGEIYLTAKLYDRAAEESAKALELAPDDPRAKQLATALTKVQPKK